MTTPTVKDCLELVRAPAAVTVIGDTMVGLAAGGRGAPRPRARERWLLPVASVLLYSAGMALNDWADRDLDAVERPERPIPAGRVSARQALALAATLTVGGVAAAAAARSGALRVAAPLAAAVWTYDLIGKHTAAGPALMALCRGLDVLLGAPTVRPALLPAAAVGANALAVTVLSRDEVVSTGPARAVAATAVWAAVGATVAGSADRRSPAAPVVAAALAMFLVPTLRIGLRAADEPDAGVVRRAVRAGIRGFVPLQSALLARAGAVGPAIALLATGLVAGRLGRRSAGDIT